MSGKKKVLKTILIIFGVIIIIFVGVNWYLLSRLETIVTKQLEDNTYKLSRGLYHLKVGEMKINVFNGQMSAQRLILYPDSSRLRYLQSVDSVPTNYGVIDIASISFRGINFRKKQQREGRKLFFTEIAINSPCIKLTHTSKKNALPKNPGKKPETLYEIISPIFDQISVQNIRIDNGQVDFKMESAEDTAIYVVNNIKFHAENFTIDSTMQSENRVLYCEDFHFYIENAYQTSPGKSYRFDAEKITIEIKDSIFSVENLKMIPQYPKNEFAHKDAKHSDWMNLSIGSVICKGIHFHDLLFNKMIKMDSLLVKNVNFENYKNQKIVIEHHKMPLIYEPFQRFKFPVDIANIKVDNINIVYEELSKTGVKPGLINFMDMHGEFTRFTNIVSSHTQMNKIVVRGKLMGQGQFNAVIHIPVDSLYDHFEIDGKLGAMNMLSLNKIIEPLAPVRVKSGFIKGMNFYITGGKYKAAIDMELLYNDLAISIQKENEDHERSERQLVSMLANSLINSDNPGTGKNKELRRVHSEWVRDPYHSSFNYLWKIYCSGLVETIGLTDKRKSQLNWIKNTFEKIKGGKKGKPHAN